MNELDLLKKNWKKESTDFPRFSFEEIYQMTHKRSLSIVKWIFIISLLEFAFWALIAFLLKDNEGAKRFEQYEADWVMTPLYLIGYLILAYFFYRFFMNYKKISTTDTAKKLMESIIKTRKTVNQYVVFNLGYMMVSMVVVVFVIFQHDERILQGATAAAKHAESFKFYAITIGAFVLVTIVLAAVLLLFYYLIYGILLRKLNKNYRELKRADF